MNETIKKRGNYEISVKRTFSAAHAIRLYDGTLEPVHGHNWTVELTVARMGGESEGEGGEGGGGGLDEIEVVVDFHLLERELDALIATADNGHLNLIAPFVGGEDDACGLAINPTAERVAWWLATAVDAALPSEGARVIACAVGEAPGCVATYRMA